METYLYAILLIIASIAGLALVIYAMITQPYYRRSMISIWSVALGLILWTGGWL